MRAFMRAVLRIRESPEVTLYNYNILPSVDDVPL